MANELTTTFRLEYAKGTLREHYPSSLDTDEWQATVTGNQLVRIVQTITTTPATIAAVDVADGGYIYLRNLGTVAITMTDTTSTKIPLTLAAGDWAWFRTGTNFTASYRFAVAATTADLLVVRFDA